jgi:hypothetical protein
VKLVALLVVIGLIGIVSVGAYRLFNKTGDELAEDVVFLLNQPRSQEQYGLSAAATGAECNNDRTFTLLDNVDFYDCTAAFADGTVRPFCVANGEPGPGLEGRSRTCAETRRDFEETHPGSTGESDRYRADRTKACLEDAGHVASFDTGNQVTIAGPNRPAVIGFVGPYSFFAVFSRDEEEAESLYRREFAEHPDDYVRERNVVYWVGSTEAVVMPEVLAEVRAELAGCLRS